MQANHETRPAFEVSITAIMTFQVAALFARSALEPALVDYGYGEAAAGDLSYLVVPPILLPLMYPYLARCRVSLRALLHPTELTMRVVLSGVALGLTLRALRWSTLTLLIWLGVLGNQDPNTIAGPLLGFDCPPATFLLLSFAVMALLIPVIEEVVNRGFILHALLPRGKIPAVALSAVLFAAMHAPSSYAITFAVGIVFAVQTLNFRTLWAPIVAHATYNAAAIIDWECFRIVWNPPQSDPVLEKLGMLSTAVTVIGALLVWRLINCKGRWQARARQRPDGID